MAATAENDGDSVSNIDEHTAGTIPTDASSLLKFTDQIVETTGGIVVRWTSELDRSYRLTASTNLVVETFASVVASNLRTTPPINEYSAETSAQSNRFFRIEVE